jgi:hypothetical protein
MLLCASLIHPNSYIFVQTYLKVIAQLRARLMEHLSYESQACTCAHNHRSETAARFEFRSVAHVVC